MNEGRGHWDRVYTRRNPEEVSWYRPHLDVSLRFIEAARLAKDAAIFDVGGGASTLVDDLLERGYENLTVLDLSETALAQAQDRLGARAGRVRWLVGDVTAVALPERACDFWHDRAVFHFLTDEAARSRYVAAVRRTMKPHGHVVVATFGPSGPERCSGLPVARYDAAGIHREFGGEFAAVASASEVHRTPWGAEQEFVYCYCRIPALA